MLAANTLRVTNEPDPAGISYVDDEDKQVTPVLKATTERLAELGQAIVNIDAASGHRAQRLLSAYEAARCILEDPPPKAKMKSMIRVVSRLLRFEEVAARKPDLDRVLAQARVTTQSVKGRRLSIDWDSPRPFA